MSRSGISLRRTGLRRWCPWLSRCEAHGLRVQRDLLQRGEIDLAEDIGAHRLELNNIQQVACSEGGAPPFRSAFQLLQGEYGLAPRTDELLLADDELAAAAAAEEEAAEGGNALATRAAMHSPAAAVHHAQAASSADAAKEAQELLAAIQRPRRMLSLHRSQPALRINKGITELVGPAGIGKTQACLTLCTDCFLPPELGGLGGGVVYIDTENTFHGDRLIELAQRRYPAYYENHAVLRNLTASVITLKPNTAAELMDCLQKVEVLVLEKQCKLIILDSIAFLVRAMPAGPGIGGGGGHAHGAPAAAAQRNETLGEVSSRLKALSEKLSVACVVTNQVAARFQANTAAAAARSEVELQAALGVAWAHAVNTRLLLQSDQAQHRFITVAKSPMFSSARYHYAITASGFEALQPMEVAGGGGGGATENVTAGSVIGMTMRPTHQMTVGGRK